MPILIRFIQIFPLVGLIGSYIEGWFIAQRLEPIRGVSGLFQNIKEALFLSTCGRLFLWLMLADIAFVAGRRIWLLFKKPESIKIASVCSSLFLLLIMPVFGALFVHQSAEDSSCDEVCTAFDFFESDFLHVLRGKKQGFDDRNNSLLIGFLRDDVEGAFDDDICWVEKHGNWGAIGRTGRVKIGYQLDYNKPFSEGLAAVKNADSHYFYIERSANLLDTLFL